MKTLFSIFFAGLFLMPSQSIAQKNKIHSENVIVDSIINDAHKDIYKHHFDVVLPNDMTMNIDLINLEDWKKNEFINSFITIIRKHIQNYKLEIEGSESQEHILEIVNPVAKDYQKLKFKTIPSIETQKVYLNNEYYNLKTGNDILYYTEYLEDSITIRDDVYKIPKAIRYQITAKSLWDIRHLDEKVLFLIQTSIDSLVEQAFTKVNKPKANWYQTNSLIDLKNLDSYTSKLKYSRGFKHFASHLKMGVGYGVTVFNSNFSPSVELSLGYVGKSWGNSAFYVGANFSAFSNFIKYGLPNSTSYLPLFVEFGTIKNKPGYIQGKSSFGFGVVNKTYEGYNHYMPGILLNFPISNTISTNFIIASEWKKDTDHYLWSIGLKYNL